MNLLNIILMMLFACKLQQDEVISELREYATSSHTPPEDQLTVQATEKYLAALNNIFERTLLGNKTRIFKPDGLSIQRLDQGFSFFEEWAEELIVDGSFGSGVDCRNFISWQVHIINLIIHITSILSLNYTHKYATLLLLCLADMGSTENNGVWFSWFS